jgi:hypothetical protein
MLFLVDKGKDGRLYRIGRICGGRMRRHRGPADIARTAIRAFRLAEIFEEIGAAASILLADIIYHLLHAAMRRLLKEGIALRIKVHILRAKTFMMQEKDGRVIVRYVPYHMLERQLIKQLPQLRNGDVNARSDIIFIYRYREGEDSGISAHQQLEKPRHRRILKLEVIHIIPVCHDLDLGGDIHIFRKGPMVRTFYILDRIVSRLSLKSEMTAELIKVELELTALTGIVRNIEEDMNLMVYVLDILEGREGNSLYLSQTLHVRIIPQQHGKGPLSVAAATSRLLEVGLRTVGHIEMDDETHIGLVYAHTEGIGTYHHPYLVLLPTLLPVRPGILA